MTTYKSSGVDDDAASRAIGLFKQKVASTFGPEVVGGIGTFGGMFEFDPSAYRQPVLVSSTDGVGTKVMVAQQAGMHSEIGIDLVAYSVNDVAAMGAKPLFFLDYIVTGKVDEQVVAQLVSGVAEGCRTARCALIGGEIAEHPGHMEQGSYDLAGFCVGVVEKDRIVDGSKIKPGDVVLGIASSGLHASGFSLVRKILFEDLGHKLTDRLPGLAGDLTEELLTPSLIYSGVTTSLLEHGSLKGLANISGGGIPGNVERILPGETAVRVDRSSWEKPAIFTTLKELGGVAEGEMFSTFNMGIGMVAVVDAAAANHAVDLVRSEGHRAWEIGIVFDRRGGEAVVFE